MMRRATLFRGVACPGAIASCPVVCTPRRGFSLIEVILATAILMGSVIVLARLAGMGRTTSQKAQQYAVAQRVCEQTLNEIVLGLRPLESVQQAQLQPLAAFADGPDLNAEASSTASLISVHRDGRRWTYSVRAQPLEEIPELTLLSVIVKSVVPEGSIARPTSFRLSRWVRNSPSADSSLSADPALPGGIR